MEIWTEIGKYECFFEREWRGYKVTVVVGIEFLFFEFFFCFWFFMENSFNLADVGNKKILLILIRKMQKKIFLQTWRRVSIGIWTRCNISKCWLRYQMATMTIPYKNTPAICMINTSILQPLPKYSNNQLKKINLFCIGDHQPKIHLFKNRAIFHQPYFLFQTTSIYLQI